MKIQIALNARDITKKYFYPIPNPQSPIPNPQTFNHQNYEKKGDV